MKYNRNVGWGMSWLWSPPYRGVEVRCDTRAYFFGHTPRQWKERGW